MLFQAYKDNRETARKRIFSIGGGAIQIEGEKSDEDNNIYSQKNFQEIADLCRQEKITLLNFIYKVEGDSLKEYLSQVGDSMKGSIKRGLKAEGILPGGLDVARKAKILYETRCYNESADVAMNRVIAAYAYAVSEENADEKM